MLELYKEYKKGIAKALSSTKPIPAIAESNFKEKEFKKEVAEKIKLTVLSKNQSTSIKTKLKIKDDLLNELIELIKNPPNAEKGEWDLRFDGIATKLELQKEYVVGRFREFTGLITTGELPIDDLYKRLIKAFDQISSIELKSLSTFSKGFTDLMTVKLDDNAIHWAAIDGLTTNLLPVYKKIRHNLKLIFKLCQNQVINHEGKSIHLGSFIKGLDKIKEYEITSLDALSHPGSPLVRLFVRGLSKEAPGVSGGLKEKFTLTSYGKYYAEYLMKKAFNADNKGAYDEVINLFKRDQKFVSIQLRDWLNYAISEYNLIGKKLPNELITLQQELKT